MERRISHAILGIAFILVFIFSLSRTALAADYYHIVKKGDTLWGICEKYYGNPWLWPKLWEMNPFVTNPHLLKPGDKINLLEDIPLLRCAAEKSQVNLAEPKPTTGKESNWWKRSLDVSGLTQVRSIGYFSRQPIYPIGAIVSSDTERLILAERDSIVVRIDQQKDVKPGDVVWVYQNSEGVRDPATNIPAGFVICILGNVEITEALGDGLYAAMVKESFRDIRVGDSLTKYNPVSPCVIPNLSPGPVEAEILATKDLVQLIGQFTVVYLNRGKDQGVDRGNLFEVVKERRGLPDLPIGYVLVLDSQPDSAVGVVVEAKKHFYRGAKVRLMQWKEAPRSLFILRACRS